MPIRDEMEADHAVVARLHRLAFGSDAEARLVDALWRSGAGGPMARRTAVRAPTRR